MTESVKSGFERPLTIAEVILKINKKDYLLPAIQREFVWNKDQIIRLFDSLMKGYTIGSFLFWMVDKKKTSDYQFYEFIKDYHEVDNKHNPKASIAGTESVVSILDGQQRMTAFYIGLMGSYAYRIPRKRKNAFPARKLYLNLLKESPDFDLKYDFRFLTSEQASRSDDDTFWFEVGKILDLGHLRKINRYLIDTRLSRKEEDKANFANDALIDLYEMVHVSPVINFYLERSQNLDKVLNIFIRVNSGGTQLSYSDLLLSIATAQWDTRDAREEITKFVDSINDIGEGFAFNKDFVLKSCLILTGLSDIAFKVNNFTKENMALIEEKWDDIQKAIRLTVEFISTLGYNGTTLTSNNALIPIAYYIMNKRNPSNFSEVMTYSDDRKKIQKWLRAALLKRSFSGQPDNILRPIRNILDSQNDQFPLSQIIDRFKGRTKTFDFTKDDIENSLILSKYGKGHTFSVLTILYPTLKFKDRIHIDHIHPRSFFKTRELRKKEIPEEDHPYYKARFDYLSNLQLLEGRRNEEKSDTDFETWIMKKFPEQDERDEYMRRNYIPKGINLSFTNFREFYTERKKLLLQKLNDTLL